MSSPRPSHAYLGILQDGTLGLFVSEYPLRVAGTRLLQGDNWSPAIPDFYNNPVTQDSCVAAIKGMEAYLRGEEVTATSMEFGQRAPKIPRKRS
jgi:hypothetical protein